MKMTRLSLVSLGLVAALSGCQPASEPPQETTVTTPMYTAEDAAMFVESAQREMEKMQVPAAKAAWLYATNINEDTATVNAYLSELFANRASELAKQAAEFNDVEVDADLRRKLDLMRTSLTMPPPASPMKSERLAQISSELDGMYGKGKYCRSEGDCIGLVDMSAEMATSRDADLLLEYWQGWREVSVPMRLVCRTGSYRQ